MAAGLVHELPFEMAALEEVGVVCYVRLEDDEQPPKDDNYH